MVPQPALTSLPPLHHGVHNGLGLVTAAASSDAELWPAARGSRGLLAGGRVDVILTDPFPVLGVDLGPLGSELEAAIAGLDVALLRQACGAAVRSAAGRVPPA